MEDTIKITFKNKEIIEFPKNCIAYKVDSGFCSCERCLSIIEATRKYNISASINHL